MEKLKCKVCGEEKPLSEMRKHAHKKGGFENICKPCRSEHRRANGENTRERARHYTKRSGQKKQLVSAEYIEQILKESCVYCGCDLTQDGVIATCDHVYPLLKPGEKAYGGVNIPQNVLPACKSCNSAKHDLYAIEAFDQKPDRFKPECLRPFARRFIGGLAKRELTDIEVEQMIQHLREEAAEVRRNEAKAKAVKVV